jgi:hypothetical protein
MYGMGIVVLRMSGVKLAGEGVLGTVGGFRIKIDKVNILESSKRAHPI